MRFDDLKLIPPLLEAVKQAGYETPSPIQQKTIPLVLSGRDVLGCAQTGTGKTAAFALPMLQRLSAAPAPSRASGHPIRALILTPTRELAIQIYENFTQYGGGLRLRTAVIFGGVGQNPQVEQLRRGVDILVATPGRLNDLIGQGHIHLRDLEIFVLDEADRMLDMGFIHDVKKVIAQLPDKRQTLLFSATMPREVEQLALQLLRDPATVKISPVTSTVDKIAQSVYFVDKANKVELLLWLLEQKKIPAALVFTRTKHGANQVATKLNRAGVDAMAIHGNKSQNARQEALGRFKAGKLRVLVATDIAARGIDVAELPFVINFNVPDTPEAYIHRIGRTGRAGLEGEAITLCFSDELKDWWDIEKVTKQHVPVGECPWSVTNMQPTQAPPPGSNRQPRNPANQPPKKENPPKKQENQPEKAQNQPKSQENTPQKSGNTPKKEQQPKGQPPKAGKGEKPAPQKAQPASKKTEKPTPQKSAQPARENRARRDERASSSPSPYVSPFTTAYGTRYGSANRPVRPFQSRASLQPKAEDFPPPAPTETRSLNWSADGLPERQRITGAWDMEEVEEVAPVEVETAAPETASADAPAPKKRRHRGGRRHRKPSSGNTQQG